MSLYKRQKEHVLVENGEKLNISSKFVPNTDQQNGNVKDDMTELLCPAADDIQGVEGALQNIDVGVDPEKGMQQIEEKIVTPVDITIEKREDPVPALEHINEEANSTLDLGTGLGPAEIEDEVMAERVEGPDAPYVNDGLLDCASNNEEVKLVDTKCDPLLNSDMMFSEASEAIMPPGSVNLSRIHHSPESTH